MKRFTLTLLILLGLKAFAQLPSPSIVGYWENWYGRFLYFSEVDSRYNVIMVSFASYKDTNDYEMTFVPEPGKYWQDTTLFKTEMEAKQAEGKKVLISLGGATYPIVLDSLPEKEAFVASVGEIIDKWDFDGIDIDLEGASMKFDDIQIGSFGDIRLQLMTEAIQEIMANYYEKHGKKLLLTMAPETIFVQGGLSNGLEYGGAYLPMIEALKDSIDMLNVQLYNSGNMPAIDGNSYTQSTPDFILAMTETVIQGFTATGDIGAFSGLPASKIGIGLPSCSGYGYTKPKDLDATIRYLHGEGPQPGNYELVQQGGYPDLKGMMTWSINADQNCRYDSSSYINLYDILFNDVPYINISNPDSIYITEEESGELYVEVLNDSFVSIIDTSMIQIENLPNGVSIDSIVRLNDTIISIILESNSVAGEEQFHIYDVKITIASDAFKQSTKPLFKNWGVTLTSLGYLIPTRIEAEDYHFQTGSEIRPTSDTDNDIKLSGGTTGAYSDYKVIVPESKNYSLKFRYSTAMNNKADFSFLVDETEVFRDTLPSTGGWDNFKTRNYDLSLTEGTHTIRIFINKGWYGLNWFEITEPGVGMSEIKGSDLVIYPNPVQDVLNLKGVINSVIKITDVTGKIIFQSKVNSNALNIAHLPHGLYHITCLDKTGQITKGKFIKK